MEGAVGGFVPDGVPQMMVIDDLDMSRLSRLHVVRKYRVDLSGFVQTIKTSFIDIREYESIYFMLSTVLFYNKSFLNVGVSCITLGVALVHKKLIKEVWYMLCGRVVIEGVVL